MSNSKYGFATTAESIASDLAAQIKDKVVLTTGVSPNSLGATFVTTIAAHQPRLLILAGRNLSKIHETVSAIASAAPKVQTRVLELDLTSQAQVRKAAKEVLDYEENIDVVVLNAGAVSYTYETTSDGLERTFAANHIGHFLFVNLILPKVLASKEGGRVVSVASEAYRLSHIRFDDLGFHVSIGIRVLWEGRMVLTECRGASRTTSGARTGSPNRRICYLLSRWLRSLGRKKVW